MAEAARILTENTSRFAGGTYLTARYTDVLQQKPEDTRTAEQVVDHIRKKLRQ